MTEWQPFREPLRTTLTRTIGIALVAGAVVASRFGGITRWPAATAMMLWPSYGGHWVELWFLNWLRPRLPADRRSQRMARVAVWFAGGMVLAAGMLATAYVLMGIRRTPWRLWWAAGLAFIAIELVAHSGFHLRGRPSFYNGRG